MNIIAFSIGPLVFHWYGVILSFSIFIGLLISIWQTKIFGDSLKHLFELVIFCVPVGILFSRIYYVAANWDLYRNVPLEWLTFWHGGLAIHGAFIGVIATLWFYTYKTTIPFWHWGDILAPGLVMAQAIGQWGNFINQEAFGYPTAASWGIYIDFAYRPLGYERYDYFHPTALYESGLAFFIFLVLVLCNSFKGKLFHIKEGSVFLGYIILYSIGRFFIESLRLDSEMLLGIRLAQVVCVLSILLASWLLICRNSSRFTNLDNSKHT